MIWRWYRLVQWFGDWMSPSRARALRAECATAKYALKGLETGLRSDRDWMEWWILGKFFRNIEPPREFMDIYGQRKVYLDSGGGISLVRKRRPKKIKSHG